MIKFDKGNLFDKRPDALVNTVNCCGVMGKGIALQFKNRYPENFKAYKNACDLSKVKIGEMFVFKNGVFGPKYIINFPTKNHWKENSKKEYIVSGLKDLKRVIIEYGIKSIVLPPLGCGNGNLEWSYVKKEIQNALNDLENVEITVFEPLKQAVDIKGSENKKITAFRAVLIKAIQLYQDSLYELSNIEIQKLVYFIGLIMGSSNLKFQEATYGPYSPGVNNAIIGMAGLLDGVTDGGQRFHISVNNETIDLVDEYIKSQNPLLIKNVDSVKKIISGYETPYGMELLGTVHWVCAQKEPENVEDVVRYVHAWSERKKELMSPMDIQKAYGRLNQCGLVPKFY